MSNKNLSGSREISLAKLQELIVSLAEQIKEGKITNRKKIARMQEIINDAEIIRDIWVSGKS